MTTQEADTAIWNGRCGPLESALWVYMFVRLVWWGEVYLEGSAFK